MKGGVSDPIPITFCQFNENFCWQDQNHRENGRSEILWDFWKDQKCSLLHNGMSPSKFRISNSSLNFGFVHRYSASSQRGTCFFFWWQRKNCTFEDLTMMKKYLEGLKGRKICKMFYNSDCLQTGYLSNILHRQSSQNFEICPEKACNLQHFRPWILYSNLFFI